MIIHPFDRGYFDSDEYRGYVGIGYSDFPCHHKTASIILDKKPESVLEIGGARGYICRLLEGHGVETCCMDISEHAWHTRVISNFVLRDITNIPWSFTDNEYDLAFSIAVLEHIPENKIDGIIREMARVSRRGLHGISFTSPANDIDDTHCTMHPKSWWVERFKTVASQYPVEIMDKEDMEKGPITVPGPDGLKKLNLGSHLDMFHYGWDNIDDKDLSQYVTQNGYVFKQHDVTTGLPYDDNSCDLIFSSHLLEHFTKEVGLQFLKECYRVSKHGGIIRISTPDAQRIAASYAIDSIRDYRHINVGVEHAENTSEAFYNLLLSGHKTIYDEYSLKQILEKAGFIDVERTTPFKSRSDTMRNQTVNTAPSLSLVLEASKQQKEEAPSCLEVKIT